VSGAQTRRRLRLLRKALERGKRARHPLQLLEPRAARATPTPGEARGSALPSQGPGRRGVAGRGLKATRRPAASQAWLSRGPRRAAGFEPGRPLGWLAGAGCQPGSRRPPPSLPAPSAPGLRSLRPPPRRQATPGLAGRAPPPLKKAGPAAAPPHSAAGLGAQPRPGSEPAASQRGQQRSAAWLAVSEAEGARLAGRAAARFGWQTKPGRQIGRRSRSPFVKRLASSPSPAPSSRPRPSSRSLARLCPPPSRPPPLPPLRDVPPCGDHASGVLRARLPPHFGAVVGDGGPGRGRRRRLRRRRQPRLRPLAHVPQGREPVGGGRAPRRPPRRAAQLRGGSRLSGLPDGQRRHGVRSSRAPRAAAVSIRGHGGDAVERASEAAQNLKGRGSFSGFFLQG
jgi:hypothetical protein